MRPVESSEVSSGGDGIIYPDPGSGSEQGAGGGTNTRYEELHFNLKIPIKLNGKTAENI